MKIRVVCLNLWQGGWLWQQASEYLLAENADLYMLQEAYNGHSRQLESRLRTVVELTQQFSDYHCEFGAFLGDKRAEGVIENGNLIISRWPMASAQTVFFDVPYGEYDHDNTQDFSHWPAGMQTAGINLPDGQVLHVANLHGPVWLDGSVNTSRRKNMINSINSWVTDKNLAIVAGDSNAKPDNPCWQNLSLKLTSILPTNLRTTFNMKRKTNSGYATAPVDVFFCAGTQGARAQLLQVDVSDHFPIRVELLL